MKKLATSLLEPSQFTITVELSSGPGQDVDLIVRFLEDYQAGSANSIPAGFDMAAITAAQNPGGVANLDPSAILAHLNTTPLLDKLDFIPHLSCKDLNSDALLSSLIGYRQRGIESVLALTGDKPVSGQGVFDLESLGLLQMMSKLNRQAVLKAKPKEWDSVGQFFPGAVVSPFKYTEPSLMQQYYKMEKKIAAGARFLVTQVGWDWRKSLELMTYLKELHLNIPVIGNVFFLTTTNSAYRRMHEGKLPGCYVSDGLFETLRSESPGQQIDRAAQQIAMYRAIGAAGVDIGNVHDFRTVRTMLQRAAEIGTDWARYQDNLYYPPEKTFYLYDDQGQHNQMIPAHKTLRQRCFNIMHRLLLDSDHRGFHLFKKTMALLGAEEKRNGLVAQSFTSIERAFKHTAFQCQECGDCQLAENFGYCTLGGCKKGLANAPCGDATVDGRCGNDPNIVCRGEHIYLAAKAEPDGIDKLRHQVNQPRDPELAHSASILNYLFGRDHTRRNAITSIAEAMHGAIPKVGRAMKELARQGDHAYKTESGPLRYIRALIEDQVAQGADYVLVNVDTLATGSVVQATQAITHYAKLVRRWGNGIPICLDSCHEDVLRAGLMAWHDTQEPVQQALVSSLSLESTGLLALRRKIDFAFVGRLVDEDLSGCPDMHYAASDRVELARQFFAAAVEDYGFAPQDIFLYVPIVSLAYDITLSPGVATYTHRSFETIRGIKKDSRMKGVRCCIEVRHCCQDLRARQTGVSRAFVAKAVEYGLDAGFVNINHRYGHSPADPGLLKLVNAFAKANGATDKADEAYELMGGFCAHSKDKVPA